MKPGNKNSFKSLKSIKINNKDYKYFSLVEAEKNGLKGISNLPKSLKVLLENLLRYEDDMSVTKDQIEAVQKWLKAFIHPCYHFLGLYGAGDGARTRDIQLGKLTLYQLSYSRLLFRLILLRNLTYVFMDFRNFSNRPNPLLSNNTKITRLMQVVPFR